MSDLKIRIIERKPEGIFDIFMYGAAEALGRGLVYALIFGFVIGWIQGRDLPDDPPQPPATGETE